MSRSGYSDDGPDSQEEQWAHIRFRGALASAIRGKRGQAMLRELATALDAMPEKALAAESLVTAAGDFCTLGVLGQARGVNMAPIDPEDWGAVAQAFGIAPALVREIVYENDESLDEFEYVNVEICGPMRGWDRHEKSVRVPAKRVRERRWRYMRDWVAKHITPAATTAKDSHG
jgi:hypothetical protein